ncbi:MAG TPA: beta-eliminating lyase-related protein, partial [Polyangiaceae bacterium]|nr:beta-eliminating lyase-related protein [Polyangiaceae bacterium]
SLVTLENTHNRAGGRIFPSEQVMAVARRARELGLRLHLDGARLWNVAAATGAPLAQLAAPFDSVSVCFSKGLGAPVGSALAAGKAQIDEAHRLRKMLGGGMRQVGVLAAAALYAIGNHRSRLVDDHQNAKRLAHDLREATDPTKVAVSEPETNIVNVDVPGSLAEGVVRAAREQGVLINAIQEGRLRAVLHLDVTSEAATQAAGLLARVIRTACGG